MATSTLPSATWHYIGRSSDFPNISSANAGALRDMYPCGSTQKLGCKAFTVSSEDDSTAVEVDLDDAATPADLRKQVLVFQYNGRFHAVDHECPHSSFPLSKSAPFDIEDFGIVLSAGITCPKHDWSFDLFSGQGDRGNYSLRRWEVQLRPGAASKENEVDGGSGAEINEIWVRRKPS